jgi:hypothetical protein
VKFSQSMIRMKEDYAPKDPEPICSLSLNLLATRTISTPCERGWHSNPFNAPPDVFRCIVIEGDGTCERRMVIRSVTLYSLIFLIRKVLTGYKITQFRIDIVGETNIGVDVCANRKNVEHWLNVELDNRWKLRGCWLAFLNWVINFYSVIL